MIKTIHRGRDGARESVSEGEREGNDDSEKVIGDAIKVRNRGGDAWVRFRTGGIG